MAHKATSGGGPSGREPGGRTSLDWRRWGIVVGILLVVGLAVFVGTAQATDSSWFCVTCHEMQPYYDAWSQGHHRTQAQCVDCHVDAGVGPRLVHKFYALAEVWSHFTKTPAYPLPAPAPVPDSRCIRCHPTVTVRGMPVSFSHAQHAEQGPCQMCHATTGHDVTARALRSAGIWSPANAALRARSAPASAAPGSGRADLPGHISVACSRCHGMAAMGCAACHAAPHEPRGDCAQCHQPGARFTFSHPQQTGMENWQSIDCKRCHPVSYRQVSCTCHGGGRPSGGD
jgi:cytochrome c nitrite reductase small subunit